MKDKNVWMMGFGDANTTDSRGWYSVNCMIGRSNTYNDDLKVDQNVTNKFSQTTFLVSDQTGCHQLAFTSEF